MRTLPVKENSAPLFKSVYSKGRLEGTAVWIQIFSGTFLRSGGVIAPSPMSMIAIAEPTASPIRPRIAAEFFFLFRKRKRSDLRSFFWRLGPARYKRAGSPKTRTESSL